MPTHMLSLARLDPVWEAIRAEAKALAENEPLLSSLVHACVLHNARFEEALSYRLAQKMASTDIGEVALRDVIGEALADDQRLGVDARADIVAVYERDPACSRYIQPMLYFKGYLSLQAYRIAHWLWQRGKIDLALYMQMRSAESFGVDIHPAARLGRGIMIDHAHSVVIGQTAEVGDNVSMLHSVTLGGTGKEHGDRHPKIGDGVLIGAGAAVLGNIHVGHCSRIAAGSVVVSEVPPCVTVAGVPAKIVGTAGCEQPSSMMNQLLGGEEGEDAPAP